MSLRVFLDPTHDRGKGCTVSSACDAEEGNGRISHVDFELSVDNSRLVGNQETDPLP
jgi:hypothetical protein